MMKRLLLIILVISKVSARSAVTLGQIDGVQAGTLDNWARGNFASPPLNVTGGRPAGSGDAFMRVTSDGGGIDFACRLRYYRGS
jgi:hypothetical protein